MLELYRAALRIRREHPGLGSGPLAWRDAPAGALVFERADGIVVAANVAAEPFALPAHRQVLLASGPIDDGIVPRDATVWLQR